nr:electron transport complex subunit E [uncultured Niameybacter sp.]
MKTLLERLKAGIIVDNPTFMQVLGMCPTLAVTTSANNAIGMGLATTAVLICSNTVISLLRKCIPSKVRIPAFVVIIASFVTMIDLLLQAYIPSLHAQLGLFLPLIVVNCLILGRAEAYASKNPVLPSVWDGLGMGLGFTLALTSIGVVREILGAGSIFGLQVMPGSYDPAIIMILAPGAFFTLAIIMAILNAIKAKKQ